MTPTVFDLALYGGLAAPIAGTAVALVLQLLERRRPVDEPVYPSIHAIHSQRVPAGGPAFATLVERQQTALAARRPRLESVSPRVDAAAAGDLRKAA